MSEMTRCNYCDWQRWKRAGCRLATSAERKDLWDAECEREGHGKYFSGGVVVVTAEGKFVSWMMELPDHCCC